MNVNNENIQIKKKRLTNFVYRYSYINPVNYFFNLNKLNTLGYQRVLDHFTKIHFLFLLYFVVYINN